VQIVEVSHFSRYSSPTHPHLKNLFLVNNSPNIRVNINGRGKFFNKIALNLTTDQEAGEIINNLINGKLNNKNLPVEGKIIKPFYLFLDEEVLLYAKLRKLKFKIENPKKGKITDFLNEMEKKHPEVKRAIVNSYLALHLK